MNREKILFDNIVLADNATKHLRPGIDDYIVVQQLLVGLRANLPERMRLVMDVTKQLNDAGLRAVKAGYQEESSRWFALAWQAARTDDSITNAALGSCVAAAEAFLHWRAGRLDVAEARMDFAVGKALWLEREHGWKFLLPLRIHYSHLMSRIHFVAGDLDQGFRRALPAGPGPTEVPSVAEIEAHVATFPEQKDVVQAPLRRMAGELAMASYFFPDAATAASATMAGLTSLPIIREAFTEALELVEAVRASRSAPGQAGDTAPFEAMLNRGRGRTITWYLVIAHTLGRLQNPAIRRALVAQSAPWPDVPVLVRQSMLEKSMGDTGN